MRFDLNCDLQINFFMQLGMQTLMCLFRLCLGFRQEVSSPKTHKKTTTSLFHEEEEENSSSSGLFCTCELQTANVLVGTIDQVLGIDAAALENTPSNRCSNRSEGIGG